MAVEVLRHCGLRLEKIDEDSKGRGVFAERPFEPGADIIPSQQPYVHVGDALRCDCCLSDGSGQLLEHCSRCRHVFYCSRECQKSSWKSIHKYECAVIAALPIAPTRTIQLLARLLFKRHADRDNLDRATSSPTYADVQILCSNRDKLTQEKLEVFAQLATLAASMVGPGRVQSASELINLLCVFSCNNYTISDGEMRPVGVGLYPACALVNHSCSPNAVAMFHGKLCTIRAIAPIAAGDEITLSYIEIGTSTAIRRASLRETFFFECNCPRCLDKDLDAVVTQVTNAALVERAQRHLAESLQDCVLKNRELLFKACEETFREHAGPYHHRLRETRDHLLKLALDRQDFRSAEGWCRATLPFYERVYPRHWPLLGLQYFMLGKLLWFLEDAAALEYLRKARQHMFVSHRSLPLLAELDRLLVEATAAASQSRLQPRIS